MRGQGGGGGGEVRRDECRMIGETIVRQQQMNVAERRVVNKNEQNKRNKIFGWLV